MLLSILTHHFPLHFDYVHCADVRDEVIGQGNLWHLEQLLSENKHETKSESHFQVKTPPATNLFGALCSLFDNFANFISFGLPNNLERAVLICPISFQMRNEYCIWASLDLFETSFLYKNPAACHPYLGSSKSTGIYASEGPQCVEYIDLVWTLVLQNAVFLFVF